MIFLSLLFMSAVTSAQVCLNPELPKASERALDRYGPALRQHQVIDNEWIDRAHLFYDGHMFVLQDPAALTRQNTFVTTETIVVNNGGQTPQFGPWQEVARSRISDKPARIWLNDRQSFYTVGDGNGLLPSSANPNAAAFDDLRNLRTCTDLGDCSGFAPINPSDPFLEIYDNNDIPGFESTNNWSGFGENCTPSATVQCQSRIYGTGMTGSTPQNDKELQNQKVIRERVSYRREIRLAEPETRTVTRVVKEDSKWEVDISPIVFVDLQRGRSIYSADYGFQCALNTDEQKASDMLAAQRHHQNSVLRPAADKGAFKVELTDKALLGAGAALSATYTNSGTLSALTPMIGVVGLAGRQATTKRVVKGLNTAKKIGALKVPSSAAELFAWNVGDELTYSTSGGVMALGGVGFYGVYTGMTYVAQGTFTYHLHKVGDNQVFAEVKQGQLKNVSAVASAGLMAVSRGRFRVLERGLGFVFDLNNRTAQEALQNFLAGGLDNAQRLAGTSGVEHVRAQTTNSIGKTRAFQFGLPYMSTSSAQSEVLTVSESRFPTQGVAADDTYGIYIESKNTRFFNVQEDQTVGFYAMHTQYETKQGSAGNDLSAVFAITDRDDRANLATLRRAQQTIARRTGFTQEARVSVPRQVRLGDRKMGSMNLSFAVQLDRQALTTLINLAANTRTARVFDRLASELYHSYFGQVRIDGQLVNSERPHRTRRSSHRGSDHKPDVSGDDLRLCRGDDRPTSCIAQVKKANERAVAEMVFFLKEANNACDDAQAKACVQALANFGKATLRTPFAFQAMMAITRGRGAMAAFDLKSTNFQRLQKVIHWAPVAQSSGEAVILQD